MLEFKEGRVVLMPGAIEVPEVKKLRSAAKGNSRDKFFNDAITYAYFMYKRDGMYASMFPKKRAMEVGKNYFSDKQIWKKFEHNQKFREFKNRYEELQYSAEERALISTEAEIEDLILHLKDIKYFIDDNIDVEIQVPKFEGSEEFIPYKVKRKVKVNNSKEKEASLKAIAEMIKIRKLLKESVKTKKVEDALNDSRSLLDSGRFDDE